MQSYFVKRLISLLFCASFAPKSAKAYLTDKIIDTIVQVLSSSSLLMLKQQKEKRKIQLVHKTGDKGIVSTRSYLAPLYTKAAP